MLVFKANLKNGTKKIKRFNNSQGRILLPLLLSAINDLISLELIYHLLTTISDIISPLYGLFMRGLSTACFALKGNLLLCA